MFIRGRVILVILPLFYIFSFLLGVESGIREFLTLPHIKNDLDGEMIPFLPKKRAMVYGLTGTKLVLGVLGLSPLVAFSVMMGSCAALMPAANVKFIKARAYHRKAALMYILFGVPGVIVAAYLVAGLSIAMLKKIVIVIVLYTAFNLVKDSKK